MKKKIVQIAEEALKEAKQRDKKLNLHNLEEKLSKINEEIKVYPSPIAGCDAQFNSLLVQRDGVQKEIAKIINTKKEVDGPEGPEPTRYGDWEKKGIVSDF